MTKFKCAILEIEKVTPNVYQLKLEKPDGYSFTPGEATEMSINKDGWKDEKRPFTFTSLNEDSFLLFTIKSYPSHDGVTEQIAKLKVGDEMLVHDNWGAITYKGEGVFIAGGAGVTPFIAIFKNLQAEGKLGSNKLIFSNKTAKDVILEDWWRSMLGTNFISTLTDEKADNHLHEKIDKAFLNRHIDDFSQKFYVCGPEQMVKDISEALEALGANTEAITFEE